MKIFRNERGASAAEYALILAIIGGVVALAVIALGGSLSNSMSQAANDINACGAGC